VTEIDLESAGELVASADHAKDYTFLIIADKPEYTAERFEKAPDGGVAAADVLVRSKALPPDDFGEANFDLAPHVADLWEKLTKASTPARMVVVASAAPDTEDPSARIAVVQPCKLVKSLGDILVADAGNGKLWRFDPKNGRVTALASMPAGAFAAALDKAGRVLALVEAGGASAIWLADPDGGAHRKLVAGGIGRGGTDLVLDPDTGELYVASHEGKAVYRVSPDAGKVEALAVDLAGPHGVALGGDFLFVATSGDRKLLAIHRKSKRVEEVVELPAAPSGVALDAQGRRAYVGAADRIFEVDLAERAIAREFTGASGVHDVYLLDAKTLLFSEKGGKPLAKLDLGSEVIERYELRTGDARGIAHALRPDGKLPTAFEPRKGDLYGATYSGEVYEMDRKTGKKRAIASGLGYCCGVAVDARGRVFAMNVDTGTITCIDPESGAKRTVAALGSGAFYLAVDPETNDLYATLHNAGAVERVNPETGARARVASGLPTPMGIAVMGDHLVVGSHAGKDLSLVHKKTGAREVFLTLPSAPSRLCVRSDDELWVTGNPDHGSCFRVSVPERTILRTYPGSSYGCVWEEDSGKVILIKNRRLDRLDPETGQTTPLSDQAGDHDGAVLGKPKRWKSPPKPVGDFWTGSYEGHVYEISLASGKHRTVVSGLDYSGHVAIDAKGRCFLGRSHGRALAIVDRDAGKWRDLASFDHYVHGIDVDPETSDVYVTVYSGTVYRVNPDTGAKAAFVSGYPKACVVAVAGEHVVILQEDGAQIFVHEKRTGRLVTKVPSPNGHARGLAIDAQGDLFLSDVDRQTVYRFSLAEGKVLRAYPGIKSPYQLHMDKDDRSVLIAQYSSIGRLDPDTGVLATLCKTPNHYGLAWGPPKPRRLKLPALGK
jgi:DNA-binding beta-propeller fold protein YncE